MERGHSFVNFGRKRSFKLLGGRTRNKKKKNTIYQVTVFFLRPGGSQGSITEAKPGIKAVRVYTHKMRLSLDSDIKGLRPTEKKDEK